MTGLLVCLVTPDELTDLQERIEKLAEILEQTLDLDAILSLAEDASALSWEPLQQFLPEAYTTKSTLENNEIPQIRIGVARDEAFCFYYEDNLDLLRQLGAEILYFSPLHDRKLPEKLQGLLIGGGYPELYAQALSENTGMLQDIRKQIAGGLPYLAECGGFMYLHESMEDMEQKHWPMVGILSGKAFYTGKLGRFGYVELTAEQDQMLGRAGDCIRAHEFHYFDSSDNGNAFHAAKPMRSRGWDCMQAGSSYAAGFPHLYYYSNPEFALNFVDTCRRYKG